MAQAFPSVEGVKPATLKHRLEAHTRTCLMPADMRRLCAVPDPQTLLGLRHRTFLAALANSSSPGV